VTGGLFQNNLAISGNGGGVSSQGTLSLSSTQFTNNTARYDGGGAYAIGAMAVTGGVFQGNRAIDGDGGGLHARQGLTVTNARFVSNTAGFAGGGIYQFFGSARIVNALFDRNLSGISTMHFQNTSLVSVIHSTIASPTRADAAAIVVVTGTLRVTNTIIVSHALGIQRDGGTVVENFNLFFGSGADRSPGVAAGPNSITGNPRFANVWAGDYHLTEASPARNTGTNAGITTDFDGNPRPIGGAYDMGYDEWLPPRAYVPLVAR
jgi:predicted outer membrane repeat protein